MAPNVNYDATTMVTKQRLIQHELSLNLKEQQQQHQQLQQPSEERVVSHHSQNDEAEARQDTDAVLSSSLSLPATTSSSTAVVHRALMVHATEDSVMAALLDEEWDTLESLCRDHPVVVASQSISMVCQGENSTCLPVHFVCGRQSTPVSTLQALVQAHPSGTQSLMIPEGTAGRLPLHLAVLKKGASSLAVVEYLCRAAPAALQAWDQQGNLPLHYAAMYASDAIVALLLEAHPPACREANVPSQRLPLHLLCARSWGGCPPEQIIRLTTLQQVYQEYPDALKRTDRGGRLPLHVHCASDPRADVLQVLVEGYGEALLRSDTSASKWNPLSLARKFTATTTGNNNNNGSSNVVLAYLIEMTNKERRKKYKFLAPLQAVGGKIVAARRRANNKPDPEALHLHYCYG